MSAKGSSEVRGIQGGLDGSGLRIGIAVARFNEYVTQRMLESSLVELRNLGVRGEDVIVVHVPGSFELPLAAKKLAELDRTDAVICLGAVIQGETPHFDHVSAAARDGILRVGLDTGKPVIFGVITTYNTTQAMARAGLGAEYARGAVEMTNLGRAISDVGL